MANPIPTTPILVTARDAAKLLAISERQLWHLSHVANVIGFVRVGSRSIRYSIQALQDFTRGPWAGCRVAERSRVAPDEKTIAGDLTGR